MHDFIEMLESLTSGFIELSRNQLYVLESHFQLLLRWNRKINLTAITDPAEAVRRHYGESLFLAANLPAGPLRIVDIGSGPGFPGFPVAVVRPDCNVTLVESVQRKAAFLKEASRSLPNVTVLSQRAELLPAASHDWLISRAVAWRDIARLRLAPRMALLASARDVGAIRADGGWSWRRRMPIPWDEGKRLLIGRLLDVA